MIFSLHIEPPDCGWFCLSERQELSRFQSLEFREPEADSAPTDFYPVLLCSMSHAGPEEAHGGLKCRKSSLICAGWHLC